MGPLVRTLPMRTDPIDGEVITRSSNAASCTRFGT
jgi:hypothetical protein